VLEAQAKGDSMMMSSRVVVPIFAVCIYLVHPANAEKDKLSVIATTNIAGCQLENHLQPLKATERDISDDSSLAIAAMELGCGALVKEGTHATVNEVDADQEHLCISVPSDHVVWMMPKFDGCIWVQGGDVK
jgi:hypothetical protein